MKTLEEKTIALANAAKLQTELSQAADDLGAVTDLIGQSELERAFSMYVATVERIRKSLPAPFTDSRKSSDR